MKRSPKPRVKICCISSKEEALTAIAHGASALGLVGEMPSGPGVISDQLIKEIAEFTPPPISTFLLTSETEPKKIIEHHRRVNTNTIQIVDTLSSGTYDQIREAIPSIKLVQVIHITGEKSIEQAVRLSRHVDALLLDSGNPNLAIKVLGGTGSVHDWTLSKTIREETTIPVFLAGGLNETNILEAIDFVKPFGVDLCSGVRTEGQLDVDKLKAFFDAVNEY